MTRRRSISGVLLDSVVVKIVNLPTLSLSYPRRFASSICLLVCLPVRLPVPLQRQLSIAAVVWAYNGRFDSLWTGMHFLYGSGDCLRPNSVFSYLASELRTLRLVQPDA